MSAMRPTRLTTTFTAGALTMALAAAVLVWPASARAAEDDDGVSADTKIIRNLMEGLGLKRDGSTGINYQQRAPLVIPSAKTLPPPEKAGASIENNPAWPVDPDATRAKAEKKAQREANRNPDETLLRERRPLRPDEMTPGEKPRNSQSTWDGYESSPNGSGNPLKPSELGYKGNIFGRMFGGSKDEEVAKFTGEPPRASLTEPPRGYQTPSPDQPYGTGKDLSRPKPGNYLQDHPVGIQ